jgi:hypothetical protein
MRPWSIIQRRKGRRHPPLASDACTPGSCISAPVEPYVETISLTTGRVWRAPFSVHPPRNIRNLLPLPPPYQQAAMEVSDLT